MSDPQKPYVIVTGIDYSETGELALEHAIRLAAARKDAELHVVNVVSFIPPAVLIEYPAYTEPPGISVDEAREALERHVAQRVAAMRDAAATADFGSPRAVTHVRIGVPAEELAQLCADLEADLAVIGTHGRRGATRILLGSVAEGLVRLAPCPVLVVRPKKVVVAPQIEPPCPECLATRQSTRGEAMWCAQHRDRHGQRHTYHQADRVASDGTMPLVFHV